ncbi:Uncharacterised protein [Mycobacterium tuberculosis]|nr:Uncharacterised protein [Mycobacterium tuberculosis]
MVTLTSEARALFNRRASRRAHSNAANPLPTITTEVPGSVFSG